MDPKTFKRISMEIIGGPSHDAVFDACKYAFDNERRVYVTFKVAEAYTTAQKNRALCEYLKVENATVTSVEYVDSALTNNRKALLVKGRCDITLRFQYAGSYKNVFYEAEYDAHDRKGNITFFVMVPAE